MAPNDGELNYQRIPVRRRRRSRLGESLFSQRKPASVIPPLFSLGYS